MSDKSRSAIPSAVIVLVVVAIFAGVLLAKTSANSSATDVPAPGIGAPAQAADESITSTHNNAVADYEAALGSGKPIYLLFHSLTCDPCVEISAVVDQVMPAYKGRVLFVNAISDDPSGRQLSSKFRFQYIPTSFFITPDGKIADSFTGAMSDSDMRARLDRLIAR